MALNGKQIAIFDMPKQRDTQPTAIIIMDGKGPKDYSVHNVYGGSLAHGSYDLTWPVAHAIFSERVIRNLTTYGPSVYEIAAESN